MANPFCLDEDEEEEEDVDEDGDLHQKKRISPRLSRAPLRKMMEVAILF